MKDPAQSETSISRMFQSGLRSPDAQRRDRAAARLWGKYQHGLLGFVRVRMDDYMRQQTSPESVLQVTFEEVFRKLREGTVMPQNRDGLLALLRYTAKRRLIDKAREVKGPQRNPAANQKAPTESSLDVSPTVGNGVGSPAALEAGKPVRRPEKVKRGYRKPIPTDHLKREADDIELPPLDALLLEATPDVRLAAEEVFELLDEELQLTFLLWIQEYSEAEVAKQLGIEPENVMLNVNVIKERWARVAE